jgi:hypothetical protein
MGEPVSAGAVVTVATKAVRLGAVVVRTDAEWAGVYRFLGDVAPRSFCRAHPPDGKTIDRARCLIEDMKQLAPEKRAERNRSGWVAGIASNVRKAPGVRRVLRPEPELTDVPLKVLAGVVAHWVKATMMERPSRYLPSQDPRDRLTGTCAICTQPVRVEDVARNIGEEFVSRLREVAKDPAAQDEDRLLAARLYWPAVEMSHWEKLEKWQPSPSGTATALGAAAVGVSAGYGAAHLVNADVAAVVVAAGGVLTVLGALLERHRKRISHGDAAEREIVLRTLEKRLEEIARLVHEFCREERQDAALAKRDSRCSPEELAREFCDEIQPRVAALGVPNVTGPVIRLSVELDAFRRSHAIAAAALLSAMGDLRAALRDTTGFEHRAVGRG